MDYEWIGPLGGLVPIRAAQAVKQASDAPVRYYDTVGGGRRAQRLHARPLREWDFSHTAVSLGEADRLRALRDGAYGRGPFVLVSTEAQISNVMTPEQADFSYPFSVEYESAGPIRVGDHYFPSSAAVNIDTGWAALADEVPVLPGRMTTVSIWALASANSAPIMSVAWRNGSSLGGTESVTGTSNGMWQRLVWQGIPPAGTDSVRFGVRSSVKFVAAPQVTWTPRPVDWGDGRGASSVIVDSIDATPRFLSGEGEQVADVTWTAMEVG